MHDKMEAKGVNSYSKVNKAYRNYLYPELNDMIEARYVKDDTFRGGANEMRALKLAVGSKAIRALEPGFSRMSHNDKISVLRMALIDEFNPAMLA